MNITKKVSKQNWDINVFCLKQRKVAALSVLRWFSGGSKVNLRNRYSLDILPAYEEIDFKTLAKSFRSVIATYKNLKDGSFNSCRASEPSE